VAEAGVISPVMVRIVSARPGGCVQTGGVTLDNARLKQTAQRRAFVLDGFIVTILRRG